MARVFFAGADIRDDPAAPDLDWSAHRRAHYLLRPDIARPLSIDRNVWGPPPHANQPLPLPWVGVEEVSVRARSSGNPREDRQAVIAIGLVAESVEEEGEARERIGVDAELDAKPEWSFLGFDVADGVTSGLSNCGYDDVEVGPLRATWAPRLNAHGLFSELADAISFRALTDTRVSEHAPFFVYGIWIVRIEPARST